MDISKLWSGFGDFMKVWGPWITTALIPTLIVGLSKSPQTQGAVAWLKYVLQFLSFLTPRDTPGTFKLPLKAVTPVPNELPTKEEFKASMIRAKMRTDSDKTDVDPPPGALLILLIGSLAFSPALSGCSWVTSIGKGSKDGVINCSVESVMSGAANLIATVRAIVTGGAVNWAEQLDALKEMGEDALACALYVVGDQLQQESVPPTDAAGDSPSKQKARATAAQGKTKTQMYLRNQNWQPTGTTSIRPPEAK
jgi:hypothetical protein